MDAGVLDVVITRTNKGKTRFWQTSCSLLLELTLWPVHDSIQSCSERLYSLQNRLSTELPKVVGGRAILRRTPGNSCTRVPNVQRWEQKSYAEIISAMFTNKCTLQLTVTWIVMMYDG